MSEAQVFAIAPVVIRSGWAGALLVLVTLLALAAVGSAWYMIGAAKRATFSFTDEGLTITGGFYGRSIPAASLDAAGARVLNLDIDRDFAPSWRTNGLAMPGLKAGWFRLHNGQKALLFVSDASRVVYVPIREDYALLVSVPDPGEFMAALRRVAGG